MNSNQQIYRVLKLMPQSDRRKYVFLGAGFCITSLLDVVGIYALSISMLYLGSGDAQKSPLTNFFQDYFVNLDSNDVFLILILATTSLFVLKTLVSIVLANLTLRHLARVGEKISRTVSSKFFSMDLSSIRSLNSIKVSHGLNYGINALAMELLGSYIILVGETFLVLLIMIVLCFVNPTITVVMLTYFGFIFLVIFRRLGAKNVAAGNLRIEADVSGNSIVNDLTNGYRDIFVLDKIERVLDNYSKKRKLSLDSSATLVLSGIVPKYVMELSLVIALAMLAIVGSFNLDNRSGFVNSVIVFFAASSRLLPSILRIHTSANTIKTSGRTSKYSLEILDLIEDRHEKEEENSANSVATVERSRNNSEVLIESKNLEFTYGGTEFVISEIDFKIFRGEFIAFAGRSGSGKSTIIDLLVGLLKPKSGHLLIDGLTPRNYLHLNPGAIGLVPQYIELFDCSIAENVALFEDSPNLGRVNECLAQAEALQFVDHLDHGVNTVIGERGSKLSGGQRQRIGIARALYRNPKILILDEATSSLDAESERAISLSIANIAKMTTTIVIAHRLSTVIAADRVFYWSAGRLVATGDFEAIRKASPEFAEQANILKL